MSKQSAVMQSLVLKIYMGDGVHLAAARIIGYAGCSPFAFWDAAKLLPNYAHLPFNAAMEDLTNRYRREGSDPKYEFNAEARKAVRVLLGPPPEDPEFESYWSREVFQSGMNEPWKPKDMEPQEQPNPERKKRRVRKKG